MNLSNKDAGLDMVGKTVAGVFYSSDDEILIVFTDGMYSVIEQCGDEDNPGVGEGCFSAWRYRRDLDALLYFGAVTQEEFDEVRSEERRRSELDKSNRLAEYERLKKEFGE